MKNKLGQSGFIAPSQRFLISINKFNFTKNSQHFSDHTFSSVKISMYWTITKAFQSSLSPLLPTSTAWPSSSKNHLMQVIKLCRPWLAIMFVGMMANNIAFVPCVCLILKFIDGSVLSIYLVGDSWYFWLVSWECREVYGKNQLNHVNLIFDVHRSEWNKVSCNLRAFVTTIDFYWVSR